MYFWIGVIFAILVVWGLVTTKDTAKIRHKNALFALFILGGLSVVVVIRLIPLIQSMM